MNMHSSSAIMGKNRENAVLLKTHTVKVLPVFAPLVRIVVCRQSTGHVLQIDYRE